MSDDGGKTSYYGVHPSIAVAIGSCDDLCWIARAARCALDLEVDTRDPFDHLNHLPHRETMAIAATKSHLGTAGAQIAQPGRVRTDEIADVDVIADRLQPSMVQFSINHDWDRTSKPAMPLQQRRQMTVEVQSFWAGDFTPATAFQFALMSLVGFHIGSRRFGQSTYEVR